MNEKDKTFLYGYGVGLATGIVFVLGLVGWEVL